MQGLDHIARILADTAGITSMMDAVPGGLVYVDAGGAVRAANRQAIAFLGLRWEEALERYRFREDAHVFCEERAPCTRECHPAFVAIRTGTTAGPVTLGRRMPDGSVLWAVTTAVPIRSRATAEVTGAIVSFLDVTERVRAENAHRTAEAQLQSVFESAPNLIAMTDLEGRIEYINRSLTQLRPADLRGHYVWHRMHPDDVPLARARAAEVIATRRPATFEVRHSDPAVGRVFNVSVGPRELDGKVTGLTFVGLDVTELRQLQANTIAADRLASVGTLAAGIAHEVNNPLTYVLLCLERLERAASGPSGSADLAAIHRTVEQVREGCERIATVVRSLRSFAHPGDGAREPVDLREVLESSLRICESALLGRAEVVRHYGPAPRPLANASRIGQIFVNLLVNAAHAVEQSQARRNEVHVVLDTAPDGRALVEVADSGPGIPPDVRPRVFEPFVTTKPAGVGTGLGLYVSHNIVRELGGEIRIAETGPNGTRFQVLFPAG